MTPLVRTPAWMSPYGPRGAFVPLPDRMRWLHPEALASLVSPTPSHVAQITHVTLADRLVFSDVYRSPAASLEARKRKRGVQRPGYSAHNFGLAPDLDVARSIRRSGCRDKAGLDRLMLAAGYRCYRADHDPRASEAWHYTFGADAPGSAAVERAIQRYYGAAIREYQRDPFAVQMVLAAMKLYNGAIDGRFGPQSRTALSVFQDAWGLTPDGRLGPETARLLCAVALTPTVGR